MPDFICAANSIRFVYNDKTRGTTIKAFPLCQIRSLILLKISSSSPTLPGRFYRFYGSKNERNWLNQQNTPLHKNNKTMALSWKSRTFYHLPPFRHLATTTTNKPESSWLLIVNRLNSFASVLNLPPYPQTPYQLGRSVFPSTKACHSFFVSFIFSFFFFMSKCREWSKLFFVRSSESNTCRECWAIYVKNLPFNTIFSNRF